MDKRFTHFETVGAGPKKTKDLDIADGETIILRGIDFSGPGGQSNMRLLLDPDGDPKVLSASNGDKCCIIPNNGLSIQGPAKMRSELSVTGAGGVEIGMIVYYEAL